MAFVYKAETKFSFSPNKEDFDLGPGQYIPISPQRNTKPAKVPFLTIGKRSEIIPKLKDIDDPGPGKYYRDEFEVLVNKNLEKDKHLNEQKVSNFKAVQQLKNFTTAEQFASILNKSKPTEVTAFLGGDVRFKKKKEITTPGPGQYYKNKERVHSVKKTKTTTAFGRLFNMEEDSNKIVSIPNKFQAYGYDEDQEHHLHLNDDPEIDQKYMGLKDDKVGPGNYNVDPENVWLKKGTEWCKFKTSREVFKAKKEFSDNNVVLRKHPFNSNNNEVNTNLSKSFDLKLQDYKTKSPERPRSALNKKKTTKSLMKNNEIRDKNRKELIKNKNNSNQPAVDIFGAIQDKLTIHQPGPGYYFDNKTMTGFRPKYCPESKQNFLSNLARFSDTYSTLTAGPGAYFIQEYKPNKDKKKNKIFPINTINKLGYVERQPEQETPGPGQYETSSNLIKKNFMQSTHFGGSEKRFTEVSKETKLITPGPGSYVDSNFSTNYTTNTKWFNPKKDIRVLQRANTSRPKVDSSSSSDNRLNLLGNNKTIVPPVGTYNPDNFNIEYKVKSSYRPSLIEAPFNTTITNRRFEKKKDELAHLGPGFYYKEKKKDNLNVNFPFNAKEKRFTSKKNEEGPGYYNRSSYFDWNKKTFNMLYL